ncbi:TPA: protein-export chaperone SecB [Morganella morganii]|nr:protein-export chaperone SecB [Morganella morganii]
MSSIRLQLEKTQVHSLKFLYCDEDLSNKKKEGYSFECSPAFCDESPRNFLIIFKLDLIVGKSHTLSVEYHAMFESSEDITEDFINSNFPAVNAPAIAFPYLRAFLSTFLMNAGFNPIMLPSINFSAIYKRKNKLEAKQ